MMKCKKRRVTPLRLGARLHSSYHFDTTMMPYRPGCVNVQLCRLCCSVYSDSTVQRARPDVYNCGAIFILCRKILRRVFKIYRRDARPRLSLRQQTLSVSRSLDSSLCQGSSLNYYNLFPDAAQIPVCLSREMGKILPPAYKFPKNDILEKLYYCAFLFIYS